MFISLLIPLPLVQVGGFASGLYLYHLLSFSMLGMLILRAIKNNGVLKFDKIDFFFFIYVIFVFFLSGFDLTKEWLIAILSFFCFYISALFSLNSNYSVKDIVAISPYYLLVISFLGISSYLNNNYLYVNPYILDDDGDGFLFTGFLGLTRGSLGVIFPILISLTLVDISERTTKGKVFVFVSILFAVFCIFLSGSRTGLALALLAICLNLIAFKSRSISYFSSFGILSVLFLSPYLYSYIDVSRYTNISSSESVTSREDIQGATISYIFNNIEHFIFGMGYNSSNFVHLIQRELTHPHNEFLLTIWSLGFVGFGLFFLMLFNIYLKCSDKYKKNLIVMYLLIFAGSMSVGGILTPSLRLAYLGFFAYFVFKSFRKEVL
ncbi:O-antigen ligase family protein [Acinetobacter haemolyticus]|nr:O-antigen ligase family protein [Acinetobacter haemolyticus]